MLELLGVREALLAAKAKIVEVSHAVGFRPDTDLTGFGERTILDFKELLPIEEDGHEVTLELHS